MPRDVGPQRGWNLKKEELEIIQNELDKCESCQVNSIIMTRGDCALKDPRVEDFRKKIHDDYDGVVLRDEVISDPPVRGDYGNAYIPLKDGAVPQRQNPLSNLERKMRH